MVFVQQQEGDPNDPENDKPPEYFELVTEAGFFIYFLIQCYVDADIQDADASKIVAVNRLINSVIQ